MKQKFDFLVLGGGSAGYAAARTFYEHGCSVAVVDSANELGGLCILRGCMPSKTLIYSAEVLHLAQKGNIFGFSGQKPVADLAAMNIRKREIISDFADYRKEQLEDGRFSLFRSQGKLAGSNLVELQDGTMIEADKIVISSGSEISIPNIPGLSEVNFKTSDDVLDLDTVPEECVVLGGGVVGCELAQFLSRVGSKVTILQRGNRLLKSFSTDASDVVQKAMVQEGLDLKLGVDLKKFTALGDDKIVVSYMQDGDLKEMETNFLFMALGRTPSTGSLNLKNAEVELLPSGHIRTDQFQRTSCRSIYAAGDCAGPHEIVHVAIKQGETAALHALGKKTKPIHYKYLLSVIFTDPQLAMVGQLPEELSQSGIDTISSTYPFDDHGKSILMEAKHGYVAIHADAVDGTILGAECVGKDAGELIHSMSVAVGLKAKVHDLLEADWYHPTLSEIWTYPLEDLAEQIPRS
jgi:pyruvate/2-oxoglutarate dehydrogenase complex dihydrolipoamide dehydrogenase (E3) component